MRRLFSHRVLRLALWGIAATTLLVCAIGIRLTVAQYGDMQGILLQTEKRSAESQVRRLLSYLVGLQQAALDDLVAAGPEPERLRPILSRHSFLREPFFIARDGAVSAPLHASAPAEREIPAEGLMPTEFESALRLSTTRAGELEALKTLEDTYLSQDLSAPWRLRARLHIAARHRSQGRAARASEVYETVYAEFDDCLMTSTWPSFLHVCLAHAEALADASRNRLVTDVLRRGLKRIREAPSLFTLEEREFFLERSRELANSIDWPLPGDFSSAREEVAAEQLARAEARNLRDWIQDRVRLENENPAYGKPQNLSTRTGNRILSAVWTQLPPSSTGPGFLAVGFQIDPLELRRALQAQLTGGQGPSSLRVFLSTSSEARSPVVLASFPGDLSFLALGQERETWDRFLSRRRRPFIFAGVLLGVLGAAIFASLVLLLRGLQRELALSRMKTEFVANVSHELKTPLALIRLCGETLLLGRLRDPAQKSRYLQVITRESVRLSHLIGNVLNFSSIEAGKKTYDLRRRDLAGVVRETLDNYRYQLEENRFETKVDVPERLPAVLADEEAVAQALINLLQNAIRYSKDDRLVEVSAASDGDAVRITVRDHGVGISTEDQARIWEDYYRSRQARSLRTRGSGLGLSLVQHIMKAHGGTIELISQPGEGSTFTLVFPLRDHYERERR